MKKKIVLIASGFMIAISLFVGGVAFAYEYIWIEMDDGEEFVAVKDQASLDVYQYAKTWEGYSKENKKWQFFLRPDDLVMSITDINGNEVDFSELKVSYEFPYGKNSTSIPLTSEEALNSDGTLNLEEYEAILVTFTYNYEAHPYSKSQSTIERKVLVEVEGY